MHLCFVWNYTTPKNCFHLKPLSGPAATVHTWPRGGVACPGGMWPADPGTGGARLRQEAKASAGRGSSKAALGQQSAGLTFGCAGVEEVISHFFFFY